MKIRIYSIPAEQVVLIDTYGMEISLWILLSSVCKQGWKQLFANISQ